MKKTLIISPFAKSATLKIGENSDGFIYDDEDLDDYEAFHEVNVNDQKFKVQISFNAIDLLHTIVLNQDNEEVKHLTKIIW